MYQRRFILSTIVLLAALVLLVTGQAWAIGTTAGTDISNQASVSFTINSKTSSANSNTETFKVDRKIRPVVANQDGGNVSVIAGGNGYALKFQVTNQSNTSGGSDYFQLTVQQDNTNFTPTNVKIYADDGSTAGSFDNTDTEVTAPVSIGNGSGTNAKTYFIVADIPSNATTLQSGKLASIHLIATAWAGADSGDGALTADSNGNDKTAAEVVFADAAGTASSDDALEGQHSAKGTFATATPISVSKSAGNGTSGYHIPGDEVTYTISVNNGDAANDATSVTVYDEIPANVTFKASSLTCPSGFTKEYNAAAKGSVPGSGWDTSETSPVNHLRCTGGTVAKSSSASMTFVVTID